MMRRAASYLALYSVVGVCVMATAASALTIRQAHASGSRESHSKASKFGVIHVKFLASAVSRLYTDGARWAAYEPVMGTTRLIDTTTGRSIDRVDPGGCANGLVAIGGGELMYECSDPECLGGQARSCRFPPHGFNEVPNEEFESRRYVLVSIKDDALVIVPSTTRVPVGSIVTYTSFHLNKIGSQWASGDIYTEDLHNAGGQSLFVNWHSGLVMYEGKKPAHAGEGVSEEPPSAEAETENVNRPGLMQRMCSPLRRTINGEEHASSNYSPLMYEPPIAVVEPSAAPGAGFGEGPAVPFQLRHCGSPRHVMLPGRSVHIVHDVQLGDDILSWTAGGDEEEAGYITRLARRSYPWHEAFYELSNLPAPSPGLAHFSIALQHTSALVFASVDEQITADTQNIRIYDARFASRGHVRHRRHRGMA